VVHFVLVPASARNLDDDVVNESIRVR
jgi:hypothetical protein